MGFDLELQLVELMNYGDCNERCERAPKRAGLPDTTSSPHFRFRVTHLVQIPRKHSLHSTRHLPSQFESAIGV
jgi:hypothetical protein